MLGLDGIYYFKERIAGEDYVIWGGWFDVVCTQLHNFEFKSHDFRYAIV